jgi:type IV secretion system protein VirD4
VNTEFCQLSNYRTSITDPVSLYIITQPNDKARLRPLVRIVVNMIVRLLADKMEFEKGRPKPTYKHKLLAMIDEFPALGKLEILQESLAFVAGYGIKCLPFFATSRVRLGFKGPP